MSILTHQSVWSAIDRIAERRGVSRSRLAIMAGLDSTTFNPSKRDKAGRLRWPTTESIARVLDATGTSPEDFVSLLRRPA